MNIHKSCNSLIPLIPSFVLLFPYSLILHTLKDIVQCYFCFSHLPFKEIKTRKMLIFYFSTNYSCLSSSFLYVDHFPTSVIFFFQSEKILLSLLMVQICWQSILSTFIHLKMSLFYSFFHGICSLDI